MAAFDGGGENNCFCGCLADVKPYDRALEATEIAAAAAGRCDSQP